MACLKKITVELKTPGGSHFSEHSDSVSIHSNRRVAFELRQNSGSYVSLSSTCEITLRSGRSQRRFALKNAMARFDRGHLSILAEEIVSKAVARDNGRRL